MRLAARVRTIDPTVYEEFSGYALSTLPRLLFDTEMSQCSINKISTRNSSLPPEEGFVTHDGPIGNFYSGAIPSKRMAMKLR